MDVGSKAQKFIIVALIGIGCILRLIWAEDMKWKYDEIWMYETARGFVTGQIPFPLLGMRSSAGILNPGASVWCFILIAYVAPNPVSMVQGVALLNIIAIALFFWFFTTRIARENQLTWLWGLAIASINPLTVLFSRKIWAQNILAPFCFLIFLGHWYRAQKWGAFLWGLVGMLTGQVHMSGFFFQAGLFVWTLWTDYKNQALKKTAWIAWIAGSILGFIPLIPWIQTVITHSEKVSQAVSRSLNPEFYLQWLTLGWGLNLEHEMGKVFWRDFLAEPRVLNAPTYMMAIAHLFLVIAAIYGLFRRAKSRNSELTFYFKAGAISTGALMILSRLRIPVYYLNILFPLPQIWVAYLYRNSVRWLIGIAIAQLLITLTFLGYVHQHGGIVDGNYGTVYRLQDYQWQNRP